MRPDRRTKSLGKVIKEARMKHCITQSELSKISGVPQNQISRYENEPKKYNYHEIKALLKILKVEEDINV